MIGSSKKLEVFEITDSENKTFEGIAPTFERNYHVSF